MKSAKYVLIVVSVILLGCIALAQRVTSNQPAVVSAVAPVYPAIAASTAILNGDFHVEVELDRTGKVTSTDSSSAPKPLRKVMEEAASRWQFVPDPSGQEKRKVQITFTFRRMPSKASNLDSTPVFYPPYRIEVRDNTEIIVNPSY
jgi:TonB family protein